MFQINKTKVKGYFYDVATDRNQGLIPAFIRILLRGASVLYKFGVSFIRMCFGFGLLRTHRLQQKVISIGNITLGGVGKTPLVELIACYLRDHKLKPAILMRGYMDEGFNSRRCKNSDEALMLRRSLSDVPVLVGCNRVQRAQEASKDEPIDVFLLDDGLQYWHLYRDLEIIALDSTNPFGNGYLIPRGILREPLNALARANMFVLTKTNFGQENLVCIREQLKKINPASPIIETTHQPVSLTDLTATSSLKDLTFVRGKSAAAFCGIGDPRCFEHTLLSLDVDLRKMIAFMDHYVYQQKDINKICSICHKEGLEILLTTQKDSAKIEGYLDLFTNEGIMVLSLKIKVEIVKGKDEFYHGISKLCNC